MSAQVPASAQVPVSAPIPVSAQVIVLNGGSSSGKSGIVRCLQAELPDPWLAVGVDVLVDAMPAAPRTTGDGIVFGPGGEIGVGPAFRELQHVWTTRLPPVRGRDHVQRPERGARRRRSDGLRRPGLGSGRARRLPHAVRHLIVSSMWTLDDQVTK